MSLTQTSFAWVSWGWSSKRFGAQRSPLVESVVRWVKALGCKACRPRRRMAVRWRCRPTRYPFAAQGDLQPTGAVAAFMPAKDLDQRRFPDRFTLGYCLRLLPSIVAAGWRPCYLAKQAHRVLPAVRFNEAVAAHRLSVTEEMAMAFFKMSSSCACRRSECYDNAKAESLWSRLKTEVLEARDWPVFVDLADAQASVAGYFDYYNHERRHSCIGYMKPYQFHQQWLNNFTQLSPA